MIIFLRKGGCYDTKLMLWFHYVQLRNCVLIAFVLSCAVVLRLTSKWLERFPLASCILVRLHTTTVNKYRRYPTDIEAANITSKLPLHELCHIQITVLIRAIIEIIHNKPTNPTGLFPRPTITLFYFHHDPDPQRNLYNDALCPKLSLKWCFTSENILKMILNVVNYV